MNFPPVYHLLNDGCLESIADKIGKEWRQFFIHLGFKTADMDHWEHDSHKSLINAIRTGLHKWKSNPLLKEIRNINIKELLDWIIEALKTRERQDIADELASEKEHLDIDQVIDRLSLRLTDEKRMLCFISLGIKIEDITRAEEDYKTLKDKTTTLLSDWLDEHLQKYWKYQEILTVLRTMEKNDIADQIIKECKISDYTDKANGWAGRKSQRGPRQNNKRTNDNSRNGDDEAGPTKKAKGKDSQENTGNKLSFADKAIIVGGMAVITVAAAATGMAVGTMANGATSDEPAQKKKT